jgi:hypothetical protein
MQKYLVNSVVSVRARADLFSCDPRATPSDGSQRALIANGPCSAGDALTRSAHHG